MQCNSDEHRQLYYMTPKIFFNANAAAVFFLERYAVAVLYRSAQHFARIDWGYTMHEHRCSPVATRAGILCAEISSIIAIQMGK